VRLFACALLAACWTGEPPPAEAPRPPPARTAPARVKPPEPGPPVDLASALRADTSLLASYVNGPIVYLDLDAKQVSVLCGAAAHQAAINWTARLVDPLLPAPTCSRQNGHYVCTQVDATNVLVFDVVDPDQPELVSGMFGRQWSGPGMHALLGQLQAQLVNPTCP
jgi:hypothetical protein